jgi:ribonuclease BN (tRNA processing enzyme)
MEYWPFEQGRSFQIRGLTFEPIDVNHKVPSSGFVISDDSASIALTGDTANMDSFWEAIRGRQLSALLIECAFPDELSELAEMSCHLTPSSLASELAKMEESECEILVINIKPSYRDIVLKEIDDLGLDRVRALRVGSDYEWDEKSFRQAT